MFPNDITLLRRVVGYVSGAVLETNKTKAGDQNDMADVVEAIENNIGINAEGAYANIGARLDDSKHDFIKVLSYGKNDVGINRVAGNYTIMTKNFDIEFAPQFVVAFVQSDIKNNSVTPCDVYLEIELPLFINDFQLKQSYINDNEYHPFTLFGYSIGNSAGNYDMLVKMSVTAGQVFEYRSNWLILGIYP